jgi:hypothetical protein
VRGEKAVVAGIKGRVQNLLDSRNVDFGIFNVGMIAVLQDRSAREQQKKSNIFQADAGRICNRRGVNAGLL